MTMYLKQLNNEPINITDDDDNVVLLDKIDHLKPSTSGFIQNKASGKVLCFYVYSNISSVQ